jgi:uncharacterized protein (DUF58 family)
MAATAAQPSGTGFVDPAAVMRIANLEFRAKVIVEGFFHGLHRSPFHGFSAEFTEYRAYAQGDDPRHLDWDLYARTDRYYIKKFEDETNLRCWLAVDLSRSMDYGSGPVTKRDFAATLLATLGWLLFRQGDAVGLMTFDAAVRDYLPPRHRRTHLRRIMHALESTSSAKSTDILEPLRRLVELAKRRGVIVLVSDFLAPIDELEERLDLLGACGHEVIVFQTLDRAEMEFDFKEAARFQDAETGERRFIDPDSARAGYLKRLGDHNERIEKMCADRGVSFARLQTDEPVEKALTAFLQMQTRQAGTKRFARRRQRQ